MQFLQNQSMVVNQNYYLKMYVDIATNTTFKTASYMGYW